MKISNIDSREIKKDLEIYNKLQIVAEKNKETILSFHKELNEVVILLSEENIQELQKSIKLSVEYQNEILELNESTNKNLDELYNKYKDIGYKTSMYQEIRDLIVSDLLHKDELKRYYEDTLKSVNEVKEYYLKFEVIKKEIKEELNNTIKEIKRKQQKEISEEVRKLNKKIKSIGNLTQGQEHSIMNTLRLQEKELESKKKNSIYKIISIASLLFSVSSFSFIMYLILNNTKFSL